MTRKTVLHPLHLEAGAKMVDFGGWEMPIHYGSQMEEHHAVRKAAGMFDVSHMTVVDLKGGRVRELLRRLLANDVNKLKSPGKALYSCMLNEQGGIIDDLIVYAMNDVWFRMVVNAATRDRDLPWIEQHASALEVQVSERDDLAMIAVQGPEARERFAKAVGGRGDSALALGRFEAAVIDDLFVARTGYTGEDGFEVVVGANAAGDLWRGLADAGVRPCGLGARDTLRLEAGMNLYGQDMDESTSPWESALGWTVALEDESRDFIGRQAIEREKEEGVKRSLVGLVLEDRGVLRHGQRVLTENGDGEVTSGTFSPTLGKAIAFARVPRGTQGQLRVDIRGRELAARVVRPPFVRNGEPGKDI